MVRAKPRPRSGAVESVRSAVTSAVPRGARLVLAVSGGRDSAVLLDAMVRYRREAIATLATFDHGTGAAATTAADLVVRLADEAGLPVARARGKAIARGEAAWREARWSFLAHAARAHNARVATAHTLDDQIETVFIRALRGAGARGLAALYGGDGVTRPLLSVPRSDVARYADVRSLQFVDDPSNQSREFLRNRVRLDLLPAFEAARPGFGAELLDIARRSAAWRADVERFAASLGARREGTSVFVPADALLAVDRRAHGLMWAALAARAGIALDRRGTERVAAFSSTNVAGSRGSGRMPLAGGHEVIRHPRAFEIRPAMRPTQGEHLWALQRSS
jgi:tRNA(Ile)-lysidine synthase